MTRSNREWEDVSWDPRPSLPMPLPFYCWNQRNSNTNMPLRLKKPLILNSAVMRDKQTEQIVLNVALQQKLIWNIWIIYVFLVLFAMEYLNWFTLIWDRLPLIEQAILLIYWLRTTNFGEFVMSHVKIVLLTSCNICSEKVKVRSGWHKSPTIITSHWVVNISFTREFKYCKMDQISETWHWNVPQVESSHS